MQRMAPFALSFFPMFSFQPRQDSVSSFQPLFSGSRFRKQRLSMGISEAIAWTLGERDKYTEGHAHRVSVYAKRLARRENLPEGDVEDIRIGGLLHDIGKIGFSDHTFSNDSEKLSQKMSDEIMAHPSTGRAILEELDFMGPVLDYVHLHHERVDGKGYPHGLSMKDIPMGAQIISVADCFDAMTTDRPYQKRKEIGVTFETLKNIRGKVLSPRLVDGFIEEIEEGGMASDLPV